MIFSKCSSLARAGAATLLAVGGLAAAAPAATAAPPAPPARPGSAAPESTQVADLALVPLSTRLAQGVQEARAKPFKFTVDNTRGGATARGVTYTVDVSNLNRDRVGYLVDPDCAADRGRDSFTCPIGDVAAGTSEDFGIPLFSTGGRGGAGSLTVTVASATDPELGDNTVDLDVTVTEPGHDLIAWAQDVHADTEVDGDDAGERNLKGVRPGETAPLDWLVHNAGSRPTTGVFYGITLPAGATFAQLPPGCVRQEIEGLAQALCEDAGVVLGPGQVYTDTVRVTVDARVEDPVLRIGNLFAVGLDRAAAAGRARQAPRGVTEAQRRALAEVDEGDDSAVFDVFVDLSAPPSPDPTGQPTPSPTVAPTGEPTGEPTVAPTGEPDGSPTAAPPAPPTASPGVGGPAAPGDGGGDGGGRTGGGLALTGAKVGLIGGVGAGVLLVGAALLVLTRRRRTVPVAPGDERPAD
ncbi:PT domain-containing protein [Micromonospora sp. PLK6-60]|uniref:PT domain-containing protein n=1 Tax=Micromonospora sp. PLK6-60 TaxID=2873383 RepID=UPI001CA6ACA0|nr:PT domain-containing protein [Micromonospora sp. PLK6-60]MBY8871909.1 PT domain-containing protein [Micromonospora sp. PLK6-60]